MNKSTITIDVFTDENKVPDSIAWSALDTSAENAQRAKAMMISFWDSAEKAALRIDLWTKDMMVDEIVLSDATQLFSYYSRGRYVFDLADRLVAVERV